jgi:Ca2+-binding RTX toxin-like protein
VRFAGARWGAAALVAIATLSLAQARAPVAAAEGKCFGLSATDYRTAHFDVFDFSDSSGTNFTYTGTGLVVIIGSPGNDQLSAANVSSETSARGAIICGKDGDDSIIGSQGGDQIKAGAGNDTVIGLDGADLIKGGAGNDVLHGGFFNGGFDLSVDTIYGGSGNNLCTQKGEDQLINCQNSPPANRD